MARRGGKHGVALGLKLPDGAGLTRWQSSGHSARTSPAKTGSTFLTNGGQFAFGSVGRQSDACQRGDGWDRFPAGL